MCDFFAEIVDIIPPTSPDAGWLVTVAGQLDARRVLEELTKLPGITIRWAHAGDGIHLDLEPPQRRASLSPIGRLEHEMQTQVHRAIQPSQFHAPMASVPSCPVLSNNGYERSPPDVSPISPAHRVSDRRRSNRSLGDAAKHPFYAPVPLHLPHLSQGPIHPSLHREILYMYKDGRPVVKEFISNAEVFVDKRAIHIGRLVKENETRATLLERFRRYGAVVSLHDQLQGA